MSFKAHNFIGPTFPEVFTNGLMLLEGGHESVTRYVSQFFAPTMVHILGVLLPDAHFTKVTSFLALIPCALTCVLFSPVCTHDVLWHWALYCSAHLRTLSDPRPSQSTRPHTSTDNPARVFSLISLHHAHSSHPPSRQTPL